ncbi:hypothetical protein D3C81_1138420 [compost metagenome]
MRLRKLAQRCHPRIAVDMHRMAKAVDCPALLLVALDQCAGGFSQLLVAGVFAQLASGFQQHLGGVLHGAEKDAAGAQQAGCDGALKRFGGAGVCQAGGNRAGRDAMICRGDQQGVDHHLFPRGGQPRQRGVEDHVDKVQLADDFGGQVQAAHGDRINRGVANLALYHLRYSSVCDGRAGRSGAPALMASGRAKRPGRRVSRSVRRSRRAWPR